MASATGPTHGISLPQYIGIPTTKYGRHTIDEVIEGINKAVQRIQELVENGDYNRIIIPCHTDDQGKIIDSNVHGLGKGAAVGQNGDDQPLIQQAIYTAIETIKTFTPSVVADSVKPSTCPRCNVSTTHTYQIDPYEQDLHEKTEYVWICNDCYENARQDI